MLRQDLTSNSHTSSAPGPTDGPDGAPNVPESVDEAVRRLDIQQSLNVLEELILSSPRVPFSHRTLVDEDLLLEQLDRIRLNLPGVFQEAVQIVQQQHHILSEAEQYAQHILAAADQEAARRLNDLGIVQQAEAQAHQVKHQLEQECEALRSQTRTEIEQWQQAAQQYWEQLKQKTEADCNALRQEADAYAAQVLQQLEQQLSDMLRVVHNGRHSLTASSPESGRSAEAAAKAAARGHPPASPSPDASRGPRSRRPAG